MKAKNIYKNKTKKSQKTIGYKDSHYIKSKESFIHQRRDNNLNLYVPDKIVLNHIKQNLIELLGEMDKPLQGWKIPEIGSGRQLNEIED